MDRLESIFERFSLRANVFNTGPLCNITNYSEDADKGYVHVLKQGTLRVETKNDTVKVISAPYLLFYIKPLTHRLIPLQEEEEVITVCGEIDFGEGLANPVLQAMPGLVTIDLRSNLQLSAVLHLLYEEAFGSHCGRQASLNRICELLVIQLLRVTMDNNSASIGLLAGLADPRLSKALYAIHKNPQKAWTLDLLAHVAGMSRASFAVKFRDTLDVTPGEYLTNWRLGLAKSLLKKGLPISIVSDQVGYGSAAAFTRSFVSRFDQTPSSWLKSF